MLNHHVSHLGTEGENLTMQPMLTSRQQVSTGAGYIPILGTLRSDHRERQRTTSWRHQRIRPRNRRRVGVSPPGPDLNTQLPESVPWKEYIRKKSLKRQDLIQKEKRKKKEKKRGRSTTNTAMTQSFLAYQEDHSMKTPQNIPLQSHHHLSSKGHEMWHN